MTELCLCQSEICCCGVCCPLFPVLLNPSWSRWMATLPESARGFFLLKESFFFPQSPRACSKQGIGIEGRFRCNLLFSLHYINKTEFYWIELNWIICAPAVMSWWKTNYCFLKCSKIIHFIWSLIPHEDRGKRGFKLYPLLSPSCSCPITTVFPHQLFVDLGYFLGISWLSKSSVSHNVSHLHLLRFSLNSPHTSYTF